MADVYIGLGSNLGDRIAHLAAARDALAANVGSLLAQSSLYDTDPWGPVPQGNYLNQVVAVSTDLPPRELLARLHEIERAEGRDRAHEVRYGPRSLDLDILLYADRVVDEDGLTIPHPRIAERAFVLVPLSEIAPDVLIGDIPAKTLVRRLDTAGIRRYQNG
ncbi:MAG TPA: 2-amino-4-hydroxy-6-hydroxymethyldihydropteridine diphosphokinase [Xanthobacteraceae bacterium]|nr:2-amino-4-hydroxy-6-hydroxymethyldihydropteridine diphosphokinase [Xanthobacteraceae bacterium]